MAKIIRQKRTNEVKPIGVVRMSGLRDAGETWGATARLADQVSDIAYERGKTLAIERAEEDFAAYKQNPRNAYYEAVKVNQETGTEFEQSATGELVPVDPNKPRQLKTKDTGLFGNFYAERLNELANQHNANLGINDGLRAMDGMLNDQLSTNNFDADQFESRTSAYMQELLKTVHPKAQAEVFNRLIDAQTIGYNKLQEKLSEKIRTDSLASSERKVTGDFDKLVNLVEQTGEMHPEYAARLLNSLEELNNAKGGNKDSYLSMVEGLNNKIMVAYIRSVVNARTADGRFSTEDSADVKQLILSIETGEFLVPGISIDENGYNHILPRKMSEHVPDMAQRMTIANAMREQINASAGMTKSVDALHEEANKRALGSLAVRYAVAKENKNYDEMDAAKRAMEALTFQGTEDQQIEAEALRAKALAGHADAVTAQEADEILFQQANTAERNALDLLSRLPPHIRSQIQERYDLNNDPFTATLEKPEHSKKRIAYFNQISAAATAVLKDMQSDNDLYRYLGNPRQAKGSAKFQKQLTSIVSQENPQAYASMESDFQAGNLVTWDKLIGVFGNRPEDTGVMPHEYSEAFGGPLNEGESGFLQAMHVARAIYEHQSKGLSSSEIERALGPAYKAYRTIVNNMRVNANKPQVTAQLQERVQTIMNPNWVTPGITSGEQNALNAMLRDLGPMSGKLKGLIRDLAKEELPFAESVQQAVDNSVDKLKESGAMGESDFAGGKIVLYPIESRMKSLRSIEDVSKGFNSRRYGHIRQALIEAGGESFSLGGQQTLSIDDLGFMGRGGDYNLVLTSKEPGPDGVVRHQANVKGIDGTLHILYGKDNNPVLFSIDQRNRYAEQLLSMDGRINQSLEYMDSQIDLLSDRPKSSLLLLKSVRGKMSKLKEKIMAKREVIPTDEELDGLEGGGYQQLMGFIGAIDQEFEEVRKPAVTGRY